MIGVLPLLLVASGFISGSETALFSLSDHQRLSMKRTKSVGGMLVDQLLSDTRGLLITLMLSNMIVNVLYFVITTMLMINWQKEGKVNALSMVLISILVLLMLILFGEVLPKLVASRMRVGWSRLTAAPLMVIHRMFHPLRVVLSAAVITPLARLIAPRQKPPELSPQELESLLTLSEQRGVIDDSEEQLLQQVLELSQLTVRNLMTPRVDIRAFDLDDDPAKLIELIGETKLTAVPVYRGDLDHIEGVMYARQVLLRRPSTAAQLQTLVRQVNFIPQQQRADRLLVNMRKTGATLAIVVDEYGGTSGLITIEDVVEHMVGDISGSYEKQGDARVESTGTGQWRVGADLSIMDWAEIFGAPQGKTSVTTLGGLVMARLGRVPREGDQIEIGGMVIEVETMDKKRMSTLLLYVSTEASKT
jgi:CBS domain containing-hemolysin-like protein